MNKTSVLRKDHRLIILPPKIIGIQGPDNYPSDITTEIQHKFVSIPYGRFHHTHTDYQIATDSDFNNIIVDVTTNTDLYEKTFSSDLFNPSTVYYVRVRFRDDSQGVASDWVVSSFFIPEEEQLESLILQIPTDFIKTAGVNIDEGELQPIGYENIISDLYPSTTTEIYIDYDKIELQIGDLLKTDNDEYFQVQSINHDGDAYVITPDHELNQEPYEIYFVGHRAIAQRVYQNEWDEVVNIVASERTQDVIDSNNPSTVDKIYINNQLIDAKPGDIFNADNNELFEVSMVGNDGNKIYEGYVKSVACGGDGHVAIIKEDNTVWVIGSNDYGQLGLGDTDYRDEFTNTGLTAKFVACGSTHTAIIREDNTVWVTGDNYWGALGLGDTDDRYEFTNTGITAKYVACGGGYTVIIKDDGSVWVTGDNGYGQLGLGDTNNRYQFTNTGLTANQVACGEYHTVIIREDGSVWSTGSNDSGQLGLGDTNDRHEFTNTGVTAKQVACGWNHTIIIKDDDSVWGTGATGIGQPGLSDQFTDLGVTAVQVSCGNRYTVIIKDDGSVWTAGRNDWGQLGLGDVDDRHEFTNTGITAKSVACGYFLTTVIREDNSLWWTGKVLKDGTFGFGWEEPASAVFIDAGACGSSFYEVYWVIPTNPLSQVPTSVYPVSKFNINGIFAYPSPTYNPSTGIQSYTFEDIVLDDPETFIKVTIDISDVTTLTEMSMNLKSGNFSISTDFIKTAGVDVSNGKLEPIDYENIIDPDYTSTTTEVYIDYNKIELQIGDLLKTDNDEYFQVQSISHDGDMYVITPDHTLDNPPNEVYFIGHRAIANKHYPEEGDTVTHIRVSEQTQDVIDPNNSSTTQEIYINDQLIDVKPGDIFNTNNNELFEVAVVHKGEKSYIENVRTLACGGGHTVIIKDDGSVWVTGDNGYGQLGLGDADDRHEFTNTGITAKQVACGRRHTVIIKDDGSVWTTGWNSEGQLGLGDTDNRNQFTDTGMTAKSVICGWEHTVIIKDDNSVWVTGRNDYGQLGLGDTNNRNQFTNTGLTAKQVACGYDHTVIIKDDNSVWVTGRNDYGQLGLGDTNNRNQFTNTGLTAKQVACGVGHTFMIKDDNSVWGTGWNEYNQLGLGDTNNRNQFTDIGLTAKFVACGGLHTVIIKDDNTVWTAGYNYNGQLGVGDTDDRSQFTDTGMTAKFAVGGESHTIIIRDDNSIWGTGANEAGELGLGDTNNRNQFTNIGVTVKFPQQVSGSFCYVTPLGTLSEAPSAVYPVSRFYLDNEELYPTVVYNSDTGTQDYTFESVSLSEPTNTIRFVIDISNVTVVTKVGMVLLVSTHR